jgi:hypothetical protein
MHRATRMARTLEVTSSAMSTASRLAARLAVWVHSSLASVMLTPAAMKFRRKPALASLSEHDRQQETSSSACSRKFRLVRVVIHQ